MERCCVQWMIILALFSGCARGRDRASSAPADLALPSLSCRALDSCTSSCTTPACAEACVARLAPTAKSAYDVLQRCVVPNCARADAGAAPCAANPSSVACKTCVMSHCTAAAMNCMRH